MSYGLLGVLYVLTILVWIIAILAARWLLTGKRPRLFPKMTRLTPYLLAVSTVQMSLSLVALTMVNTYSSYRAHGFAADIVGLSAPAGIVLALAAVYVVDRCGRARGVIRR